MKQCYPRTCYLLALFILLYCMPSWLSAQCTCSDGTPAMTQEHVLNSTFSTNNTTVMSMPKFDPSLGTLVCMNAKVYLTSVLRMRLENDDSIPIEYLVRYNRVDTFTGSGIQTPVTGSKVKTYGPYNLDATDEDPGAGPDFVSIGPDTIYNRKLYEVTTSEVAGYLGTGSINFQYKSVVNTFAIGSDVYGLSVSSQNKVEFRMTYSYCNAAVLPLDLLRFRATLLDNHDVELYWKVQQESKINTYDIEFSEDGTRFRKVGSTPAKPVTGAPAEYLFKHHLDQPADGKRYYRIRQSDNKSSKYSEIISVLSGQAAAAGVKAYPNPASRTFNLEFDTPVGGEIVVYLSSQSGQPVLVRPMEVNESTHLRIDVGEPPLPGLYFVRVLHKATGKTYAAKVVFAR